MVSAAENDDIWGWLGYEPWDRVFDHVVMTPFRIIGAIMNAVLCVLIVTNKHTRTFDYNLLAVNAVNDCVLLVCYIRGLYERQSFSTYLYIPFGVYLSCFLYFGFSFERFVLLLYPLKYKQMFTKLTKTLGVMVIVTLALICVCTINFHNWILVLDQDGSLVNEYGVGNAEVGRLYFKDWEAYLKLIPDVLCTPIFIALNIKSNMLARSAQKEGKELTDAQHKMRGLIKSFTLMFVCHFIGQVFLFAIDLLDMAVGSLKVSTNIGTANPPLANMPNFLIEWAYELFQLSLNTGGNYKRNVQHRFMVNHISATTLTLSFLGTLNSFLNPIFVFVLFKPVQEFAKFLFELVLKKLGKTPAKK